MVVSEDLAHFNHVHPVQREPAVFDVRIEFPNRGRYMLFADFVPLGGGPQLLQQLLVAPGALSGDPSKKPKDSANFQIIGGQRVDLVVEELRLGTPALLSFRVTTPGDESAMVPVTDLEPYLGAAGHLFVTSDDFQDAAHAHPLEESAGPEIRFLVRFAREGRYRAWLQFQRNGEVLTTGWTLHVPAR
jgi:hypothetical protein